ncbi:MAG: hypothetical protein Hyperionvirus38_15 [Hyperionvirus sp.]|uniref:Ceramidase n=1 Tax=Hyperionvirus sp. TaxID=2487770 RepID=A0A3G5AC90_9VIRU|nr:MAG: hypothetical protein Hyperionvirus38_15 [Hyperionvirus sp.]
MVAIATIFDKTLIFRLAFGFVLAVIIFGSIFVLRLEKRDVDIYGLLGICLIIGSSILWLITEGMCPAVPWMKYIPGHGMWHIGLACGGFLLTEYYTFILAKDFGRYAKLSLGPCGIPLVDYHALQLDNTYISFFEDDDDDYKKTDLITAPYGT